MNIDLRKTIDRIARCLPEEQMPTLAELDKMYDLTLQLRSQLLGVICDTEIFGGAPRQVRLAERRCGGLSDGTTVSLLFNEPLPATKGLSATVEEHWLDMLHNAIHKASVGSPLPYFKKAFVQIEIITPKGTDNAHVWDTSNRAIQVILNNLKGILFYDDDMEHMAFSVLGSWGERGVTIVRISELTESQQIRAPDLLCLDGETMSF